MSFSHWKKFDFFTISNYNSESSQTRSLTASVVRGQSFSIEELNEFQITNISDLPSLKFIGIVLGTFFVGTKSGILFSFVGDEKKGSILVHNKELCYMTNSKKKPVVLTIGIDETEYNAKITVKLWEVFNPTAMREINSIYLSDNVRFQPVCYTVNDQLNAIAIGTNDGLINLYFGDFFHKITSKRTLNIENKAPITNLFFMQPANSNSVVLYYTTSKSIGSFFLTDRGDSHFLLEEGYGCEPHCADIDQATSRLIVNINALETISVYYLDHKAQTWMNEGPKVMVKCYRSQVVVVTMKNNMQHQVAIYDVDHQFSGLIKVYTNVDQILCEDDALFIFSRNNKKEVIIQELHEKTTDDKLKLLFKKNNYEIARSLAKAEGYQDTFIADIIKRQGDHYYSIEDFDSAINYYKQTVGYLEPSYVIIKFLDPNKIEFLTEYLEDLHKKHKHSNEHTALLLNCYVHLKKPEQLDNFLAKSDEDLELFGPKIAIQVCCEAKCYDAALSLAQKHSMHSVYVKILIENVGNYKQALFYMKNSMSISGCAKAFKEHGQTLMKHEKASAKGMIFSVINSLNLKNNLSNHLDPSDKDEIIKKDSADLDYSEQETTGTLTYYQVLESVMSGLVNNLEDLDELLTTTINKTPDIDQSIYHKLFELYLQQRNRALDRSSQNFESYILKPNANHKQYGDSIKSLLEEGRNRYDNNYVLMLLKMYDFPEGIVYISSLMGNKEELLYHFIRNSDDENIWFLCQEHGNDIESNLWIQALTYFCNKDSPQSVKYIQLILQAIENKEFLTPLIVLEILSKNRNITFGTVKHYIKCQLNKCYNSMESDQSEFTSNTGKITRKKEEISQLKTTAQRFQPQRCASCDTKLVLPTVHFMCGHSFHEHCLADNERECQLCFDLSTRAIERKRELDLQSREHGNFYKELEESPDRFSVIAQYFGRGLFSN